MIIPIFIMRRGCPHRCIFCNVRKTVGNYPERLSKEAFDETVHRYLGSMKKRTDRVQIAFYGGNFTGMEKSEQLELLEFARPFIEEGTVDAIRISTRPDCIDHDILDMLKKFNVLTVEIGAQSMVDDVLNLAKRGHSARDVKHAINMLKEQGFETGMHLMLGLPGDSPESFAYTVEQTIALRPDFIRLHATLVLEDTDLAASYFRGDYTPLSLAEAIQMSATALKRFEAVHIPVIRMGLYTTSEMEAPGSIVAGPHHPAFRSLVEESLYFDKASSLLETDRDRRKDVTFVLSPKDESAFRGQKNRNLHRIRKKFGLSAIRIAIDPNQTRRSLYIMNDNEMFNNYSSENQAQGVSIV